MFQPSRTVITFLNILLLLISVPILITGYILRISGRSECDGFLQFPFVTLAVFLFVVSLMGLVGSCCRNTFLLWLYLWVMFILLVGLLSFTLSVVIVTNKGGREGKGLTEYKLEDFSNWLQENVVEREDWVDISSCLVETQACRRVNSLAMKGVEFSKKFSPLELGCCKPPAHCGYEYKNGTTWTATKSSLASKDHECISWSNHEDTLCYDCETCKAGFLALSRIRWRRLSIFTAGLLVFLIIAFTIGCCAFRRIRSEESYMKYSGHA